MPVPHFNIKITQRSKGNSAVAGAAYQAGEKLFSEYDQKTKNYTCKKEVVYTEIMLPPNAPPEYADRATLWNSVEEIEKQWNSQLARRFVAALPREVPMELLPQIRRIDTAIVRSHFLPAAYAGSPCSRPLYAGYESERYCRNGGYHAITGGKIHPRCTAKAAPVLCASEMDGQSMSISKEKRCMT